MPKCAGLAQEIGFSEPNSCSLPWLVKGTRLSISDWSIIMIGPSGLLLVVPKCMKFQLQFYWWGCQKKKS
jgi:hypothetical protein